MTRTIKLQSRGVGLRKPKNYSKKGTVCSVLCIILDTAGNILDRNQKVVYEVEPNKDRIYSEARHNTFSRVNTRKNRAYWGSVKNMIELPSLFDKLADDDFSINTGYFTRDNVEMPYVTSIEIKNGEKYKILKTKEDRKKKLTKISNSLL